MQRIRIKKKERDVKKRNGHKRKVFKMAHLFQEKITHTALSQLASSAIVQAT